MFKKFIHINCTKATMLIVQKEEVKLSLINLLRLKYHQKICAICYFFEQQSLFISKNTRKLDDYHQTKLTQEDKKEMNENLFKQEN